METTQTKPAKKQNVCETTPNTKALLHQLVGAMGVLQELVHKQGDRIDTLAASKEAGPSGTSVNGTGIVPETSVHDSLPVADC